MKRASFGRGLGFAVLAGMLTFPVQLFGSLVFGYDGSLARLLLGLSPLSLLFCAPSWRAGISGTLLSGALACGVLLANPSLDVALLGALVILGLGRAVAYPTRSFARALALELTLGLISAALFASLSDGHLVGDAFAIWSFWLMQSAFALVARAAPARDVAAHDRFEDAAAQAYRLMQS